MRGDLGLLVVLRVVVIVRYRFRDLVRVSVHYQKQDGQNDLSEGQDDVLHAKLVGLMDDHLEVRVVVVKNVRARAQRLRTASVLHDDDRVEHFEADRVEHDHKAKQHPEVAAKGLADFLIEEDEQSDGRDELNLKGLHSDHKSDA